MNGREYPTRVLAALAVAAVAGIAVFAFLAWRSVTVEHAEPDHARRRFAETRDGLAGREPMLRVDAAGCVVPRAAPPGTRDGAPDAAASAGVPGAGATAGAC